MSLPQDLSLLRPDFGKLPSRHRNQVEVSSGRQGPGGGVEGGRDRARGVGWREEEGGRT